MKTQEAVLDVLGKLQSEDLSVFPYRCVVMRNRNASCLRCAQACTSGAISVTDDALEVDPDLCVGCGTCATVCPTCALEARHPNDAALYQRAARAREANGGAAVVVCDAKREAVGGRIDPEKVARVTCLGRVEESLLVGLVADGASSVRLVHGSCGECPRNAACETYPLVAETANLLLETWDAPVRVELSEKLPASVRLERPLGAEVSPALAYDEGKRQMFSQLGAAAGEAVASGLAEGDGAGAAEEPESGARQAARFMKVMTDGTLPHFLPDRRERLLDALAVLGDPADVALDTRLWGRVTIDVDACKSCYMCATFCPTGAIRKFADGEDAGVEHIPGDCVKCRCCTDVCPTDALTLHEDVMAREVLAGAVVERMVLPPVTDDRGGAHSMIGALRKIIHCDQLYER